MTDEQFNESLCKNCIYCVRRTIIPTNIDDFENWPIDLTAEDCEAIENGETIVIDHIMCLALTIELEDHIVIECNKFMPENRNNIINDTRVFM